MNNFKKSVFFTIAFFFSNRPSVIAFVVLINDNKYLSLHTRVFEPKPL